jgi:ABC-type Mn2+/Zn2+ transport system ATPase subunit
MKNFNGYWFLEKQPILKNLNLTFEKGKFYGIVGKVGSSKSSLLYSIIGEMPYYGGFFAKEGT